MPVSVLTRGHPRPQLDLPRCIFVTIIQTPSKTYCPLGIGDLQKQNHFFLVALLRSPNCHLVAAGSRSRVDSTTVMCHDLANNTSVFEIGERLSC